MSMDNLLWLLNLPFWQVAGSIILILLLSFVLRLLTTRSSDPYR